MLFQLYKEKYELVSVTEYDQENELRQLNRLIESQNVESINLTVMNCTYSEPHA